MNELFDSVADGLVDKSYAIIDNFLTTDEVAQILTLPHFNQHEQLFKKAGIGKNADLQINEAIRGDYILWLDKNTAPPAAMVYLNRLNELIQHLNRSLFLSMKDYEVHMTVYPVGTYYKRHLDQFKKDDHRKLSVICYLNTNWKEEEGGQLRIYTDHDSFDVLPVAGRLVCFRSDVLEHEVLPATRQRLSLTGWILDQQIM
ncbi:oxidoreductase [Chryseotalea sanaruensis]|uniref:Oxidoreductase n=1 Tax=Chryseotalea sanaruensis TaxID=2482724 RepID=A0A401U786_9BACT|nr:2OG-Fe(II) oxygenase [Chryseotalea sanaruensis]GCC50747.1 oxidoreductase [Chryseotalea sanaruensis]